MVTTCVGLFVFVLVDQPQGGTPTPTGHAWAAALGAFGGAAAVMTLAAHWGAPRRRAALYASAAAIVWALVATFIKTATETLTTRGRGGVHRLAGVCAGRRRSRGRDSRPAFVGPLSVSQPLLVIVDPSVSVVLSIWLFQESYTRGPGAIAATVVGFAVMCVGVVGSHEDRPLDDAARGAAELCSPHRRATGLPGAEVGRHLATSSNGGEVLMMRLRRLCVGALAGALLGVLLTSGPAAASPSPAAGEPHYSLYADFLRLGKLSINPTTHECTVEGLVPLAGRMLDGIDVLRQPVRSRPAFSNLGLRVEGIAHHNGRVAYSGWGRLSLEFAGTPRVWVEVRNSP